MRMKIYKLVLAMSVLLTFAAGTVHAGDLGDAADTGSYAANDSRDAEDASDAAGAVFDGTSGADVQDPGTLSPSYGNGAYANGDE